jgi:hypothetical protein
VLFSGISEKGTCRLAISINRDGGQPAKLAPSPTELNGISFFPLAKTGGLKLLKSGFGSKDSTERGRWD